MSQAPSQRDYSLVGRDAEAAVANGLAAAEWYHTDIPRKQMKELMKRSDGPAIRDTLIWGGLLIASGAGGWWCWGTAWCVPLLLCYGVLYGSATDSRWHECGHGTAFKTRWMNDTVYQVACFMIMREPTIWRWSHTRHHTDSIIVGRDPEIVAMRPPDIVGMILNIFAIKNAITAIKHIVSHAFGRLTAEEMTFVPKMERPRVYVVARLWLMIHLSVVAVSIWLGWWLPVMLVGVLPAMYGGWLSLYLGLTQHAGLAENVLDHRLNARTVYMNPVLRFIYWNMNYHVEHHMFPMVPYHRLPELHEIMLPDTPKPYASTIEAYREIIPTLWLQLKNPEYFVKRELPPTAKRYRPELHGDITATAAE
jgi:fatty acid desaturase